MNNFKVAFLRLSEVFIPNRCEFCGEVVAFDSVICDECSEHLPKIKPPLCKSCGQSKSDCKCNKNKNEFKQIVAPYYYSDNVVKAVHRFKNSEMTFLGDRFARDIAAVVNDNYSEIDFDAVTFVPMTKIAKFKRGYNQSQILAEKVSEIMKVQMKPLLVKAKYTKPQKRLSARQRKVNLYAAFDVCDKEFTPDKTILIIDDVKTTGSTLNECAKMLKLYGAKDVYCAALALTPPLNGNK